MICLKELKIYAQNAKACDCKLKFKKNKIKNIY